MNSKLLTIDQVADYMGVHRDTVYSLIRSGRLPALQLGGRKAGWRITEEDLNEFVSQGKAAATDGFAAGSPAHVNGAVPADQIQSSLKERDYSSH